MAVLVPDGPAFRVLPGEGGHVGFSPQDETQARIHATLLGEHGRVTWERVVSGPGLAAIHRILAIEALDPSEVADRALADRPARPAARSMPFSPPMAPRSRRAAPAAGRLPAARSSTPAASCSCSRCSPPAMGSRTSCARRGCDAPAHLVSRILRGRVSRHRVCVRSRVRLRPRARGLRLCTQAHRRVLRLRHGGGEGDDSLDIDRDGNLVVADSSTSRLHIIIGDGKDARSVVIKDERLYGVRALASEHYAARASTYAFPMKNQPTKTTAEMRLFHRLGPDGRAKAAFGDLTDFGDAMTNATGNGSEFDIGPGDALYARFNAQNRIEKYAPDGTLLWRADRPLNYTTEVRKKGKVERTGGGIMMSEPEMNVCSKGIAVDGKGRAWVVTHDRQLRKEEEVQTSMMSVGGPGGAVSNVSVKTTGNTDLRTTDAFKLEIFSPDGVILGEVPITHFADVIRIFGDRLFLIDRERGITVYEYRIVEK